MKTLNLITIVFLFILSSCNSQVKTDVEKVDFGVFEMVTAKDLSSNIIDSLKSKNVRLENDAQLGVIGYILESDSTVLQLDFTSENIRLVKTYNTVDPDNIYYAIAAVKLYSVINNADIRKTNANGNNVDIEFNLKGAKKWADMTKNNVGNTIAFVIDNQIYSMPKVVGEIKRGVAMIYGLENESIAKEISESLNASRE